jgi:hypothetical protein
MDLINIHFEGLTSIDVVVKGKWSSSSSRDWRGTIFASEPIVAISFLVSSGICQWVKSERDQQPPDIRCAIFPYDNSGLDVQVNFGVGNSNRIWRTLISSASYRPTIPEHIVLRTARIHHFTTITGNPLIELYVLLIAKTDVASSRNTLWRLREQLAKNIHQPWRQRLTHSRRGQFDSSEV